MSHTFERKVANLASKWNEIEGWCSPQSFSVWAQLLHCQARLGIHGHLCEVGVYKGKTAALLAAGRNEGSQELLFLLDNNFQKQEVMAALRAGGLTEECNVSIFESDSFGFDVSRLPFPKRSARWFHIDGNHTGSGVLNDLEIAHEACSKEGIVVIDDFFSYAFAQITFTLFRYLSQFPERLVPFLIGFGKAYLCRPEYVDKYKLYVASHLVDSLERNGFPSTLAQTTAPEEFPAFGIMPRFEDKQVWGWRVNSASNIVEDYVLLNRWMNHQDLVDLRPKPSK